MSTNKNTVRSPRQSLSQTKTAALENQVENLQHALETAWKEKNLLQQQIESVSRDLGQERLFWYYMAYNFRFHHARMAVASTEQEIDEATLNVQRAVLDLLMSPSEPSSSFTKSWHQDHQIHRVLAGPDRQQETISESNRPGRMINASKLA